MKTTIHNKTQNDFNLKERTAGVSRELNVIKKSGGKYVVDVNSDATYKEYWCVTNNDDLNAVILSSDDCLDFKEIEIVETKDSTPAYKWKGTVDRKSQKTNEAGVKGWLKEKWNALSKKGESPT